MDCHMYIQLMKYTMECLRLSFKINFLPQNFVLIHCRRYVTALDSEGSDPLTLAGKQSRVFHFR